MKLKDALVGTLLWLGIIAFVVILSGMDSWPDWFLALIAVVVWMAYILVAIRDHERQKRKLKNPVLWMVIKGPDGVKHWAAMDGSGRRQPLTERPPQGQPVFDQEEAK